MPETLRLATARRIALAAQGFADKPPGTAADRRHIARVFDRVGVVQIDSVNVLARSHYLPKFARLGPYPRETLETMAYRGRRRLFEYWAHEASLLPVVLQPLMRWRMDQARAGEGIYGQLATYGREERAYIDSVLDEVRNRGGLSAGDLSDGGKSSGGWWGWSRGKMALEWLFWAGLVTTADRRGFERVYDLPERVLPADILATPTPPMNEAQRALIRIAARAMGVATETDLRDYFRLPARDSKLRVAELVENGELIPVSVEGWRQPAYLAPDARRPRRIEACALLSPFDSLVWFRERTERLFDFHYRLEIYTPAEKRRYGYYVLPFLLNESLVGRVDLKADRTAGCLRALAVHLEPGVAADSIAQPLVMQLERLAAWLGLSDVQIARSERWAAAANP